MDTGMSLIKGGAIILEVLFKEIPYLGQVISSASLLINMDKLINESKDGKIKDSTLLSAASDILTLAGSMAATKGNLLAAAGIGVVAVGLSAVALVLDDSTVIHDTFDMLNNAVSGIFDIVSKGFESLKNDYIDEIMNSEELSYYPRVSEYKKNLYNNFTDNLEKSQPNGHSLGGATINISLYDPIALDLNNNGKIDTLSLENGVFFDHNGDEIAFKSSWISAEDGVLARDINGDKEINSGAELFGNFTQLKNGELAKNGVEALKDLDSDDNGVFDESDKAFNEILVWQDINSNGKAESGELKSLSEHGIKSINLEFLDDNTALDKDNKQILVGSFAINDSDNALASDIDFSVNTVEREMAESAGLIKGTGFVRDLADALVLSANSDNALVDIYNEFASLDEKQKQLKILPKLVNEWAKTSKHYKSINDDESFLQQNKINIVNIRSDVSTSYVNSLKSNDKVAINQELENTNNANIQSLTPSGLNKLLNQRNIDQDLLKQVLELKDKYSVLQAFSGKDIQTLYYDSNEDLLNIKANITKSYQAILDYTYKSSLMQTRLN